MREIIAVTITLTAVVGSIVLAAYYWPLLPERVAEHFDAGGNADRWTSKGVLVATHICLQLGFAAVFAVLAFVLRRIPASMLNIPNKEYWLSEQRKAETLSFSMFQLLVIGAATCVFMLILSYLVYQASLQDDRMSPFGFWGLMGVYMGFIFALCGYSFWRFRLPKDAH